MGDRRWGGCLFGVGGWWNGEVRVGGGRLDVGRRWDVEVVRGRDWGIGMGWGGIRRCLGVCNLV